MSIGGLRFGQSLSHCGIEGSSASSLERKLIVPYLPEWTCFFCRSEKSWEESSVRGYYGRTDTNCETVRMHFSCCLFIDTLNLTFSPARGLEVSNIVRIPSFNSECQSCSYGGSLRRGYSVPCSAPGCTFRVHLACLQDSTTCHMVSKGHTKETAAQFLGALKFNVLCDDHFSIQSNSQPFQNQQRYQLPNEIKLSQLQTIVRNSIKIYAGLQEKPGPQRLLPPEKQAFSAQDVIQKPKQQIQPTAAPIFIQPTQQQQIVSTAAASNVLTPTQQTGFNFVIPDSNDEPSSAQLRVISAKIETKKKRGRPPKIRLDGSSSNKPSEILLKKIICETTDGIYARRRELRATQPPKPTLYSMLFNPNSLINTATTSTTSTNPNFKGIGDGSAESIAAVGCQSESDSIQLVDALKGSQAMDSALNQTTVASAAAATAVAATSVANAMTTTTTTVAQVRRGSDSIDVYLDCGYPNFNDERRVTVMESWWKSIDAAYFQVPGEPVQYLKSILQQADSTHRLQTVAMKENVTTPTSMIVQSQHISIEHLQEFSTTEIGQLYYSLISRDEEGQEQFGYIDLPPEIEIIEQPIKKVSKPKVQQNAQSLVAKAQEAAIMLAKAVTNQQAQAVAAAAAAQAAAVATSLEDAGKDNEKRSKGTLYQRDFRLVQEEDEGTTLVVFEGSKEFDAIKDPSSALKSEMIQNLLQQQENDHTIKLNNSQTAMEVEQPSYLTKYCGDGTIEVRSIRIVVPSLNLIPEETRIVSDQDQVLEKIEEEEEEGEQEVEIEEEIQEKEENCLNKNEDYHLLEVQHAVIEENQEEQPSTIEKEEEQEEEGRQKDPDIKVKQEEEEEVEEEKEDEKEEDSSENEDEEHQASSAAQKEGSVGKLGNNKCHGTGKTRVYTTRARRLEDRKRGKISYYQESYESESVPCKLESKLTVLVHTACGESYLVIYEVNERKQQQLKFRLGCDSTLFNCGEYRILSNFPSNVEHNEDEGKSSIELKEFLEAIQINGEDQQHVEESQHALQSRESTPQLVFQKVAKLDKNSLCRAVKAQLELNSTLNHINKEEESGEGGPCQSQQSSLDRLALACVSLEKQWCETQLQLLNWQKRVYENSISDANVSELQIKSVKIWDDLKLSEARNNFVRGFSQKDEYDTEVYFTMNKSDDEEEESEEEEETSQVAGGGGRDYRHNQESGGKFDSKLKKIKNRKRRGTANNRNKNKPSSKSTKAQKSLRVSTRSSQRVACADEHEAAAVAATVTNNRPTGNKPPTQAVVARTIQLDSSSSSKESSQAHSAASRGFQQTSVQQLQPIPGSLLFDTVIARGKYTTLESLHAQKRASRSNLKERLETDCMVCFSQVNSDTNPVVYCSECHMSFHQTCYGIHVVPEGQYLCDRCAVLSTMKLRERAVTDRFSQRFACPLCPETTLPVKKVFPEQVIWFRHEGQDWFEVSKHNLNAQKELWMHPFCLFAFDIADFRAGNIVVNDLQRTDGNIQWKSGELVLADKVKRDVRCKLCENDKGLTMKCTEKDCLDYFHPLCAFFSGMKCSAGEKVNQDGEGISRLKVRLSCLRHGSCEWKKGQSEEEVREKVRADVTYQLKQIFYRRFGVNYESICEQFLYFDDFLVEVYSRARQMKLRFFHPIKRTYVSLAETLDFIQCQHPSFVEAERLWAFEKKRLTDIVAAATIVATKEAAGEVKSVVTLSIGLQGDQKRNEGTGIGLGTGTETSSEKPLTIEVAKEELSSLKQARTTMKEKIRQSFLAEEIAVEKIVSIEEEMEAIFRDEEEQRREEDSESDIFLMLGDYHYRQQKLQISALLPPRRCSARRQH